MRRIVGVFSNVNDARNALGRIKKESWNRAEISVLIKQPSPETSYEFGEDFSRQQRQRRKVMWSGLKQEFIDGVGMVQIGSTNGQRRQDHYAFLKKITGAVPYNLDQKIVGIIEVEDDLVESIYTILNSKGADIVEGQGRTG